MRVFAIAFAVCVLFAGLSFADPVPGHFFFNLNDGACTIDCSAGWIPGQEFDPSLDVGDTNPGDFTSGSFAPPCIECFFSALVDPDIELDLGDASVPFVASNPFFANSSGGGFGAAIGADYQNDSGSTFVNIFLKIPGFGADMYNCTLDSRFGTDASCGFKIDSSDPTILDVGFFHVDIPSVATPEPAALPMISLALLGIGGLARRKVWRRN